MDFTGPDGIRPFARRGTKLRAGVSAMAICAIATATPAYAAAATQPATTPGGGDYLACLEQALELVRYDERRAEQAAGRRLGLGIACVVEPSISNMGYITLAQTPAERAATLPKSGNVEGCILTVGPHGGISVRISRRRRARDIAPWRRRSWPTGSGSRPRTSP